MTDLASALDYALSVVAPVLAFWLPVALVIDVAVWLVGGTVLWRRRERLSRRQVAVLGGALVGMVAVRVLLAAWL